MTRQHENHGVDDRGLDAKARDAAETARDSRAMHILARLGFATSGLVHVVIGLVALRIGSTAESNEADQAGALAQLAAIPFGVALLWITAIGLAALGTYLVLKAALTRGRSRRIVKDRVLSVLKAAAYFVLGWTALLFAQGTHTNAKKATEDLSLLLLAIPGGAFIVGALGLVVTGIGLYFVAKGATRRFRRDITFPGAPAKHIITTIAIVGYVAKGLAIVATGILFVVAAVQNDPAEATGLDGGLHALLALPFGDIVVAIVGIGFIAYGVYSFARARLARL